MGNEVSKVVHTASHVQSMVNSVVNPGVAHIVGTVAGKDAGAATRAIGQTVSTVTSMDGAAQAAAIVARNTAVILQAHQNAISKSMQRAPVTPVASGGSIDASEGMTAGHSAGSGVLKAPFTTRLMQNIQRPEVMASSMAGGVMGVLGADNGGMRLFLGAAGAAAPPIAYTALT